MDRFEVLLSRGQDENPRRSGFDERFSGTTVPPGKPEDGEAVPFTTPFSSVAKLKRGRATKYGSQFNPLKLFKI
jgi:hypothetical protein